MKMVRARVSEMSILFGALATAGACGSSEAQPRADEQGVKIAVSPLSLDAAEDACYSISVRNSANQPVWSEDWICASQYGSGSSITYIGPCDADDGVDETPQSAINTVSLVLRAICGSSPCLDTTLPADLVAENDLGDWQNPCPAGTPCEMMVPCIENVDTFVEFNITVMREANQGFFDIAVNFEDIFCSAKLDCSYADANPDMELLHNPNKDGSPRDTTFVVGFACTGGANSDTQLHLNPGRLVCLDTAVADKALEVSFITNGLEVGNMNDAFTVAEYALTSNSPAAGYTWGAATAYAGPDFLFQHAYYRGLEQLGNYKKMYSNAAYGMDYAVLEAYFGAGSNPTCVFTNEMTASDGAMPSGWIYPTVQVCADVYANHQVCGQNPLNEPGGSPVLDLSDVDGTLQGGVFTSYTNPNGPQNPTLCGDEQTFTADACISTDDLGNLVACPAIQFTDMPRQDVGVGYHHMVGAAGYPSGDAAVTFLVTGGGTPECRGAYFTDIEATAWSAAACEPVAGDPGYYRYTFVPTAGKTSGTYFVQVRLGGTTYQKRWYVHESLDNAYRDFAYCDQRAEWPSDDEFFQAALQPIPTPYGYPADENFALPAGGVLPNPAIDPALGPQLSLVPPQAVLPFSNVDPAMLQNDIALPTAWDGSQGLLDASWFTTALLFDRTYFTDNGEVKFDNDDFISGTDPQGNDKLLSIPTYLDPNGPRAYTRADFTIRFALPLLSLRHKISYDATRNLYLIVKAYESRVARHFNADADSYCSMSMTFGAFDTNYKQPGGQPAIDSILTTTCDALVLNVEGSGLCFQVNAGVPTAVVYSQGMVSKVMKEVVFEGPGFNGNTLWSGKVRATDHAAHGDASSVPHPRNSGNPPVLLLYP